MQQCAPLTRNGNRFETLKPPITFYIHILAEIPTWMWIVYLLFVSYKVPSCLDGASRTRLKPNVTTRCSPLWRAASYPERDSLLMNITERDLIKNERDLKCNHALLPYCIPLRSRLCKILSFTSRRNKKKVFFFSISNICSLDRVIDEYLINEHFEVEIVFVVFILLENEPLVLIVFEKDGNIPLSLLLDVIA